MERMMKPHMSQPNAAYSSSLAMHRNSHVISKLKSKIRIIHVFAPEVIKTDAANFRELVQRLTGKPTDQKGGKKETNSAVKSKETRTSSQKPTKMMDLRDGVQSLHHVQRIKGEEEEVMWGAVNPYNFVSGYADLDGFIQSLNEFPLLPLNASYLDVLGGARQLA